ncbi:MAG: hypothetical protein WKI04_07825, partial [Ferruginibacter sp.]
MRRRKFIQQSAFGTAALLLPTAALPGFAQSKIMEQDKMKYSFLWGSAYYRAPIPEEEFWDADFKKMQE